MKCYDCGNSYIEHNGPIKINNEYIGEFTIYLEKYFKCSGCGQLLFPKEAAQKIALKEEEIQNNLILKLPVEDFITPAEAADILGISKQAFHKHRRIKKGFIYSIVMCGRRLYNKKSVLMFKEKKDGRFNLSVQSPKEIVKYVFLQSQKEIGHNAYLSNIGDKPSYSWETGKIKKSTSERLYYH